MLCINFSCLDRSTYLADDYETHYDDYDNDDDDNNNNNDIEMTTV